MKLDFVKNVKIVEEKVGYSSKPINSDHVTESGLYRIECPKCKKVISVSYTRRDDDVTLHEKFCPYCGKRIVKK